MATKPVQLAPAPPAGVLWPAVIDGDYFQFLLYGDYGNQTVIVTNYAIYRENNAPAPVVKNYWDATQQFFETWLAIFEDMICEAYKFNFIAMKHVTGFKTTKGKRYTVLADYRAEIPVTGHGSVKLEGLPPYCNYTFQKVTHDPGRGHQGSLHLTGVPETVNNFGRITDAAFNASRGLILASGGNWTIPVGNTPESFQIVIPDANKIAAQDIGNRFPVDVSTPVLYFDLKRGLGSQTSRKFHSFMQGDAASLPNEWPPAVPAR